MLAGARHCSRKARQQLLLLLLLCGGRMAEGHGAVSERGARDLLNLCVEFLQFLQYNHTVGTLLEERASKRSQLNNSLLSARAQSREARERLRAEMMRKFDEGRRDDFFSLWQQFVPAAQQGFDFATQGVYFAIYPVLPSSLVLVVTPGLGPVPAVAPYTSSSRHEMALRMRDALLVRPVQLEQRDGLWGAVFTRGKVFKSYLEGRGASLAHTADFLPYYALPYVPQPEHHPSFEALFQSRWVDDQRLRLKTFLESVAAHGPNEVPQLYVLYTEHLARTGAP
ncbi:LisH domain-containing protein ARMC9 [Tetrabaena socialis]|uniref:LisH domain-containing protein ARMC9 n=1 Tax=Tetrabaena socialis TaxID=47790 RepID=A0A2J8A0H9_9CHLO|nr:LisH domain-containing protein ARMC9 [Tetrabaena socialis]|eukprot:PNH06032.1 LisH domain-containing protein ARMC9 [Tetrabaena socialis]